MFEHLPFDGSLVDLENYTLVYKILDNAADDMLYFGERVACCRPLPSLPKRRAYSYSPLGMVPPRRMQGGEGRPAAPLTACGV